MLRSKLEDNYALIYNAMEKYELTFLKEIDNLIFKMWPSIYDVTLKVAFLERRLDKPALEATILIPTFYCSVPNRDSELRVVFVYAKKQYSYAPYGIHNVL